MIFTAGALLAVAVACGPASAGFVVTFEAPGVQATTVANTVVETFDSLTPATGVTLINSALGTYTSAGLAVLAADQFGGANQTTYVSVGAQSSPVTSMTLDLIAPAYYFGFYSAAMDASNRIDFFRTGNLVVSVDLGTITGSGLLLTSGGPNNTGHNGNPNTNENTGEPYVFVNFFATGPTAFDRIVIRTDSTGSGYETDNHTVRFSPVPPPYPGTPLYELATAAPVPAPPTALAALAAVLGGGFVRLRRVAGLRLP